LTGLDTNVLLAWLLEGQARALPGKGPYRVPMVVLAELVGVLERSLKRTRDDIAKVLTALQATSDLRLAGPDIVAAAAADYAAGPADFADYLILHDNAAAGCKTALTLDRKAGRHAGFTLLG